MEKIKLTENQLKKIIANCVKEALNEINGAQPVNNAEEPKGKSYFEKNGIIALNYEYVKVYVTTTFLGNRKVGLSLGARWSTCSQKRFFNEYTVNEDCILVIVNEGGRVIQFQYSANGREMAYDRNDMELDERTSRRFRWLDKEIKPRFQEFLNKTKEMCAEEDEFFASKTSKTYARMSESRTRKSK